MFYGGTKTKTKHAAPSAPVYKTVNRYYKHGAPSEPVDNSSFVCYEHKTPPELGRSFDQTAINSGDAADRDAVEQP